MALRVLPAQLRQFPETQGSIYVQALEEIQHPGRGASASNGGIAPAAAGRRLKKRRPGFTARLSEPPACSVLDPRTNAPDSTSAARRRRFSAHAGSVQQTHPQRIRIQPEPGTRNGLSLARNDACATITRSKLPACPFDPAQKPAPTRSISGSPLSSVSKPKPGEFFALDPLLTPDSRALLAATVPTPLWVISTLRIKAFNGFAKRSSPHGTSDCFPLPATLLFRWRFGSMLETPLCPARLSFRKPWN